MFVKASGITNLTDARYFAAREVQYLGFNLEEGTEDYLDPMYMKAIREWVEGPSITGEFSRSAVTVVREAATFFGLDAVQVLESVHGASLSELEGIPLILHVDAWETPAQLESLLQRYADQATLFLLDFSGKKTVQDGMADNAAFWHKLCQQYPHVVPIDADPQTLTEILALIDPAGIRLRGGA